MNKKTRQIHYFHFIYLKIEAMAKGARASTIKSNNAKLKANVFGPIETARTERLSAKLLELASAPKPVRETEMKDIEVEEVEENSKDGKSSEGML